MSALPVLALTLSGFGLVLLGATWSHIRQAERRLAALKAEDEDARPPWAPAYWDQLESFASAAPAWPRVVSSPVWLNDILPWHKRLLYESMKALTVEADPEKVRAIQIRCWLLDGLIREPERQIARMQASLDNKFGAGDTEARSLTEGRSLMERERAGHT